MADVGFHSGDEYIGVTISAEVTNPNYTFSLCSTSLIKCVPINTCNYAENDLFGSMDSTIQDAKVKTNFLSHEDGFADGKIEDVYHQIQTLLQKVQPNCQVPDLKKLESQLHPQQG